MTVLNLENLKDLPSSFKPEHQLAILERGAPLEGKNFFEQLTQKPLSVIGTVSKDNAEEDIRTIIEADIPKKLASDSFFQTWISDMAKVCQAFCEIQKTDSTGFCLGSDRGCRRYHIDNVDMRLLVTYFGKGTEWLLDEGADREAYEAGKPNEKIMTQESAKQFLSSWDVAVFRGVPNGFLHRTPDDALNNLSILMRLDHPSFWPSVFEINSP